MDVALVGERVVPRQWEVGGGENEDECTASPFADGHCLEQGDAMIGRSVGLV